jgi:hypothetical protein
MYIVQPMVRFDTSGFVMQNKNPKIFEIITNIGNPIRI